MILKMQKLTLIGFLADKEALLKDLMRKKCVQIEGPENIQDYESISAITVPVLPRPTSWSRSRPNLPLQSARFPL